MMLRLNKRLLSVSLLYHSAVLLLLTHCCGGTASSPAISLEGTVRSSSKVVLLCKSKGWYLKPEVLWLDGEGNLLPAGPTETDGSPDDLYTVSSRVTVEKRHGNNFTCRVQQKDIDQTRETHFHIPDDFFIASCGSAACITISLAASFISVLTFVFAVWKWRQTKIKTKVTLQREKQQLMEESERMKESAEELQRKEKEHVDRLVNTLRKQRDQLKVQKEKIQKQVEENEKKLESVEKDQTVKDEDERVISAPAYIKLKEVIYQYKVDLKDTLSALDRLVLNTERLLVSTEVVSGGPLGKMKEARNHMDEL